MVGRRAKHRSREEWQRLFDEQQASGSSVAAFCRERNVLVTTLRNARQRLGMVDERLPSTSSFVPVEVLSPPARVEPWDVELSLGESVVLRLRRR